MYVWSFVLAENINQILTINYIHNHHLIRNKKIKKSLRTLLQERQIQVVEMQ